MKSVDFRYSGAKDLAIKNVSLDIEGGTVAALVGPSGCGKSTLLRLIAGLLLPTSGELFLGGDDALELSPESRMIGWVPQSYALFNHMTVYENVAFGLRARKVDRQLIDERVKSSLELSHIAEYADRYPRALSGGQRQRVAIARALATKPRVLLLDEPLAALDPQLRATLRVTLSEIIRDSGVTTVMVTHDQTEALAMADKVAVMKDGEMQQYDSPETLWSNPKNIFVAEFVAGASIVTAEKRGEQWFFGDTASITTLEHDGNTLELALRPADLQLSTGGEGADFRVLGTEYTGHDWLVSGELESTRETVRVLSENNCILGKTYKMSIRSDARISAVGR